MVKCLPLFDANLASLLAISGGCYPLKIAKNCHLDVICDVITPDDVIFGVWKCFYCAAGKISYGIGYGLHIIYVFKVVKMSEISDNQWNIAKIHNFGTIDDVISPDDNILRFWKCYHCVPGHISYRIRYMICVKMTLLWSKF